MYPLFPVAPIAHALRLCTTGIICGDSRCLIRYGRKLVQETWRIGEFDAEAVRVAALGEAAVFTAR